jgi:hypothetical protein
MHEYIINSFNHSLSAVQVGPSRSHIFEYAHQHCHGEHFMWGVVQIASVWLMHQLERQLER